MKTPESAGPAAGLVTGRQYRSKAGMGNEQAYQN
jgi:hypothetical protein